MKRSVWIIFVYLFLLTVAIPWYWPEGINPIILGFPAWVLIAIVVSIITSIFTAFILLRYPWSESIELDE